MHWADLREEVRCAGVCHHVLTQQHRAFLICKDQILTTQCGIVWHGV